MVSNVCRPLCSSCSGGYARYGVRCSSCWSKGVAAFVMLLGFLGFGAVVAVSSHAIFRSLQPADADFPHRGQQRLGMVRITLSLVQCIVVIWTYDLQADAPALTALVEFARLAMADSASFPAQCATGWNLYQRTVWFIFLPLIIAAVMVPILALLRIWQRPPKNPQLYIQRAGAVIFSSANEAEAGATEPQHSQLASYQFSHTILATLVLCWYIVYVTTSSNLFATFDEYPVPLEHKIRLRSALHEDLSTTSYAVRCHLSYEPYEPCVRL